MQGRDTNKKENRGEGGGSLFVITISTAIAIYGGIRLIALGTRAFGAFGAFGTFGALGAFPATFGIGRKGEFEQNQ